MQGFRRFFSNEDGATAIEYALIGLLASITIVAALPAIGSSVLDMFTFISESIEGATGE